MVFGSTRVLHAPPDSVSGTSLNTKPVIKKKTIEDFPVKKLDQEIVRRLGEFQLKCVDFKYSKEAFADLKKELVEILSQARDSNESFKFNFRESNIEEKNDGEFLGAKFTLDIFNGKTPEKSDYLLTLSLEYSLGKIYLSQNIRTRYSDNGPSYDRADKNDFLERLHSTSLEIRNFDGKDIATSPASMEAMFAVSNGI